MSLHVNPCLWHTRTHACAQGPVMFDENGDRKGLTGIEQLQGDAEVRVAVYYPSPNVSESELMWENHPRIIWRGSQLMKTLFFILKLFSFNFAQFVVTDLDMTCYV